MKKGKKYLEVSNKVEKMKLYTLDEALEKNRIMLENEGKQAWNQREYKTLQLIKDYFINE